MSEDMGASVGPSHGGPDANRSAKGLEARVVSLGGPVSVPQGSQNGCGAAAQGQPLGCRGDRQGKWGAGDTGRDVTREVSRVESPTRGVWGDADAKEKAGTGRHNMRGVRGDQRALGRGQNIGDPPRQGGEVRQRGVQFHEI